MANYLLSWNDEYRDMQIVDGPFATESEACCALKENTAIRLIELYGCSEEEAAAEVDEAFYGYSEGKDYPFNISTTASAVQYCGMLEDRFQIVEY